MLQSAIRLDGTSPRGGIQACERLSLAAAPSWDAAVAQYEGKGLFHETAWMRFIERSQRASVHALRFLDRTGHPAGYFCGAEVRHGPFKLLGSPLQGWTTNFMGPLVRPEHAVDALQVLDRYCGEQGIDYIEIANPNLSPAVLQAAGYRCDEDHTYLVTLDDEASVWGRFTKDTRRRIRRAPERGLRVERTTDPAFVGQYYAQLVDVFARFKLVPTYGQDRVQALWDCLMPAGRMLAVRVWHEHEVVATGIFVFDERVIYSWGTASWTRAFPLSPNELVDWEGIQFGLERGIPLYNMCGGGTFKPKFGGERVTVERWFKTRGPVVTLARSAYRRYVTWRQRVRGRLRSLGAGASLQAPRAVVSPTSPGSA